MKSRTAARIGIGVSLLVVVLTIVLDIFPYDVVGFITLLLAIVVVLDALREYSRPSPPPPRSPANWNALEQASLPRASAVTTDQVKERFGASYEVHGKCVPRTGAYGLIKYPLSLDE
jgi:hypothetical protein